MLVQHIARAFVLDFIANPYLCYTEHGQHALFYTMLYNALPAEQRFIKWGDNTVCVIQKEYPTAGNLGKPQRQHWDIAVLKDPPSSIVEGDSLSYDYLKLAAVVEFGMNEAREHLIDDIERICHVQANLELGIIVHLYRLSKPGARLYNRDWSSNSPRIVPKEDILTRLLQLVKLRHQAVPMRCFHWQVAGRRQHRTFLTWVIAGEAATAYQLVRSGTTNSPDQGGHRLL